MKGFPPGLCQNRPKGTIVAIEHDPLQSERYIRQALSSIPLEVLGTRLRNKRMDLGLSIRELSARALVSKTSIVSMEQGKSCRPSTLVKICSAMGLHAERFLEPIVAPSNETAVAHRREEDR